MSSSADSQAVAAAAAEKDTHGHPLRKIPGGYGVPLLGAVVDRLAYFYFQGEEPFFRARIQKYSSTVFRTNMPPGPFISSDPRVVAVLDAASFPVLFDLSRVDKRDVLTGTFVPPLSLTGGHRVLAYLDPSEPNHPKLKRLLFSLLSLRSSHFLPAFSSAFSPLFSSLDDRLEAEEAAVSFTALSDVATFDFLARAFLGASADPAASYTREIVKWLFPQVSPVKRFGVLPSVVEDFLLHTFQWPSFLVRSSYQRLYDFVYARGTWFLDEAEKMGIGRGEACDNLLFAVVFNAYGGFKVFLPLLIKWVGLAGEKVHQKLADEIRSAVKTAGGGKVTLSSIEQMPLMKSVVYEALRIEPPIPYQYARVKKDIIVESHDSEFEVKKREMIFGFHPFATKDPKVFVEIFL